MSTISFPRPHEPPCSLWLRERFPPGPFLPAAKQRRPMGGKYKSEEEVPGKFSSSLFDFRNSRNQMDRGHQNIGHRGCLQQIDLTSEAVVTSEAVKWEKLRKLETRSTGQHE